MPRASLKAWRWAFALAACTFLIYAPSLSGDFVMDDYRNIQSNPWLASPAAWPSFFYDARTTHSLPLNASYRPLLTLSLALSGELGGFNPFWFHLADVLGHCVNTALLFWLCLELSSSAPAAAAGAALFALHPAQVESVAYIDGARPNVCSLLFCLAAFLVYRRGRRAGAAALFACALLFKETAVCFPLWLAVHDLASGPAPSPRELWRRWSPFAAVLAAYLAARRLVIGATGQEDWAGLAAYVRRIAASLSVDARVLLAAPGSMTHCRSAFAPAWPVVALVLLLAAGVVAAAIYSARRRRLEGLGLCFFLLALLPVSQLIPLYAFAADRFLYWPLAGLAVALAGFLSRRGAARAVFAAAALALWLLPGNIERQLAWQDQFRLDVDSYAAAPDDPCTSLSLSFDYFNWGMPGRVTPLLRRAVSEAPPPELRAQARDVDRLLKDKMLRFRRKAKL